MQETGLLALQTTKAQAGDQPSHLRSLIRTFIIHLLEIIISEFSTNRNSSFLLVIVAEQAGLSLTWLENPKTIFSHRSPNKEDLPYPLAVIFLMHQKNLSNLGRGSSKRPFLPKYYQIRFAVSDWNIFNFFPIYV